MTNAAAAVMRFPLSRPSPSLYPALRVKLDAGVRCKSQHSNWRDAIAGPLGCGCERRETAGPKFGPSSLQSARWKRRPLWRAASFTVTRSLGHGKTGGHNVPAAPVRHFPSCERARNRAPARRRPGQFRPFHRNSSVPTVNCSRRQFGLSSTGFYRRS